jgi:hypothetical protein
LNRPTGSSGGLTGESAMQPTSLLLVTRDGEPNIELLRRMGWSIGTFTGDYCVAWRGRDEVVFEWKAGGWHRLGGRGGVDEL